MYIIATGKTACSVNNGNCTHFCIPLPDQKKACICPMVSSSPTNATATCTTSMYYLQLSILAYDIYSQISHMYIYLITFQSP